MKIFIHCRNANRVFACFTLLFCCFPFVVPAPLRADVITLKGRSIQVYGTITNIKPTAVFIQNETEEKERKILKRYIDDICFETSDNFCERWNMTWERLWRSLLLPGWGQYYHNRSTSVEFFTGMTLGGAALATFLTGVWQAAETVEALNNAVDARDAASDGYRNEAETHALIATVLFGIGTAFYLVQLYHSFLNGFPPNHKGNRPDFERLAGESTGEDIGGIFLEPRYNYVSNIEGSTASSLSRGSFQFGYRFRY